MDKINYTNPLETIQLISIFSYLNALNDILFIENYLLEDDRSKQIPIINGLYKYLEDYHDDKTAKLKLIRKLLEGSDLYGEHNSENLDVDFVNTMFEYIISSVVFNRFGNVYGFLANVVSKTQNLQIDNLHKEIIFQLQITSFANEFGSKSFLTPLAVNKIFTDLILPLFPQPKATLNLKSLDYIYAQAGSIFLRSGRINTTFYTNDQNIDTIILDQENLFNEYAITGKILQNILLNGNNSYMILRAFALPALLYDVSDDSSHWKNTSNAISSPVYWKKVYEKFFFYIQTTYQKIRDQLESDTNYQLHEELSTFIDLPTIAKFFLDLNCRHLTENQRIAKIPLYIEYSEYFMCKSGEMLEDVNELFVKYHLNQVSDAYEAHDLKIIKQSFGQSLVKSLDDNNVVIKLLAPNDYVTIGIINNKTRLPYDLLEFYFPDNATAYYYALVRKNYNITLIKEVDNPQDFQEKTGLTLEALQNHKYYRLTLKFSNQTINEFWKNFMGYKKIRLRSYLKSYDISATLGEWWKEFGLTLVPLYPCLPKERIAYNLNGCVIGTTDNMQFSENFDTEITNSETRSLLTSIGTTIRTAQHYLIIDQEYTISDEEDIKNEIIDKLILHMEEPGYDLTSMTEKDIILIQKFIDILKPKTDNLFTSVSNMLNKMKILKKGVNRRVGYLEKISKDVYVKTVNVDSDTGYGYKFINVFNNRTAQLRTNYTSRELIFVSLLHIPKANINVYLPINIKDSETYEFEDILYEVNNHLIPDKARVSFAGISTHLSNEKLCDSEDYEKQKVPSNDCIRNNLVITKNSHTNEAVKLALSKNINLTRMEVLETMEKYTFPDDDRLDLQFVEQWTSTADLKIPEWSKNYILENSNLLLSLRYHSFLGNRYISDKDGTHIINSIYSFKERRTIEAATPLTQIIHDYIDQRARYFATFEDYYAIRNFVTTGYTRIAEDTNEAKLMKVALYKLAIRQSDDLDNEFDHKLFKIETLPTEIINRTLYLEKRINLKKFTLTSISLRSVIRDAAQPKDSYRNVIYEFKFSGPYLRTKIEQLRSVEEEKVILLPGSEFTIESIVPGYIEYLGNVVVVGLRFNYKNNQKYEWYKDIMKEIARITE